VRGSTEDVAAALAGRDPARAVVLLAHDPGSFRRAASHGVDLQLSGHTHGGQIWPFNFVVRLAVPWVAGIHLVGASRLYVSRGSGFWGPPMRLFAPAEITEIVLRRG
jgi:predicted MPP superfamily phosphohydrolase